MNFTLKSLRTSLALSTAAFTIAGGSALPMEPDPEPQGKDIVVSTTRVGSSFLGIGVAEVDSARAKVLNLSEEHGVEVTLVEEESPAAKGGLQVGDVVLDFNSQRVEGVAQFKRLVQETPLGREVKLSISRMGTPQTIAVRTSGRKVQSVKVNANTNFEFPPFEFPNVRVPDIRVPEVPRPYFSWRNSAIGLESEALESQLAEYFGVKEGVLVRAVTKGSSADVAGLRAGDVILKVDDTPVKSPREVFSTLRSARGKKTIPFAIMRERREMSVALPVNETVAQKVYFDPVR